MLKLIEDRKGSMAVEFALIAPVFLLMLIGIIAFSIVFSIASGLQQLAAESARAAVAGISTEERTVIAQDFVGKHVGSYAFVLPQQLTVTTAALPGSSNAFRVSLTYDLSRQAAVFKPLMPFIPAELHGSAVISVRDL